jgi:glyoxylase-like metal-dependent hydrolase (beta-lactamase superfamily II)
MHTQRRRLLLGLAGGLARRAGAGATGSAGASAGAGAGVGVGVGAFFGAAAGAVSATGATAGATAGLLAGCAGGPGPGPATVAGGLLQQVAPGVYAFIGQKGSPDERNLGRVGNAGFIVGDKGVIAIDTGTSWAHGQALLGALRQVTQQPVRVALVTHTRPEFLFGGGAYRAAGIPVRMHTRTATLMKSRCDTCLKALRREVGEVPMQGTEMYTPEQTFEASEVLTLIGRPVRVVYQGHSSGPGDIAVLDETSGVLFAGGLADHLRIPDIQDSLLSAWHRALASLGQLPLRAVVPGHGPVANAQALPAVDRYLTALETRVRQLVMEGASLLDAPDAAEVPAFAQWDQYDLIHRRNASVAYLRFERETLFQ